MPDDPCWYFVMDAYDEILFTYALRDTFDGVVIRDNDRLAGYPELPTLAHTGGNCGNCGIFIPSSAFDVELEDYEREPFTAIFDVNKSFWYFDGTIASRWTFDPPYLHRGDIYPPRDQSSPARTALVEAFWDIFTRVTTNRTKLIYPQPDGSSWCNAERDWCGHHALSWCRSRPNSIIGDRLRPRDDWEIPQDPWYRDLWDRVVADYGTDFADPDSGSPLLSILPRGVSPNAPR